MRDFKTIEELKSSEDTLNILGWFLKTTEVQGKLSSLGYTAKLSYPLESEQIITVRFEKSNSIIVKTYHTLNYQRSSTLIDIIERFYDKFSQVLLEDLMEFKLLFEPTGGMATSFSLTSLKNPRR